VHEIIKINEKNDILDNGQWTNESKLTVYIHVQLDMLPKGTITGCVKFGDFLSGWKFKLSSTFVHHPNNFWKLDLAANNTRLVIMLVTFFFHALYQVRAYRHCYFITPLTTTLLAAHQFYQCICPVFVKPFHCQLWFQIQCYFYLAIVL